MNKKYARIGFVLLRTLLMILLVLGISVISRFIFVENMFEQEYFGEQALNIWHTVFFLFIFSSLVVALNSHDKIAMEKFLAYAKSGSLVSAAKFIVTSFEYYIELACITVVSLILPTSFLYGFAVKAFFFGVEITAFQITLYTLLIMLPLMFVLDFLARISIAKKWYQSSKSVYSKAASEKKNKIPPTIKSVITVAIVYFGASMVIPWLLPLLITLWNIGDGLGLLWIIVCLISVVLVIIILYYLRAIYKRRDFVIKLKKYCKNNSLHISDIKKPYYSIFVLSDGFDFSIEKDNVKYDCKFIAGVFPGSPIVFSDKGNGIQQNTLKLFRVEVFHILTKFDFAYESDSKKILIVLPTPKKFYVSTNASSPHLADAGEKVGEYTIYNSTGFLSALDRNCL